MNQTTEKTEGVLTLTQVLDQVKLVLERPGQWTRGAFARNSMDKIVLPCSSEAVKFCLAGAVAKIAPCVESSSQVNKILGGVLNLKSQSPRLQGLVKWNDAYDRTHHDVMTLLQQAREMVQADEAEGHIRYIDCSPRKVS